MTNHKYPSKEFNFGKYKGIDIHDFITKPPTYTLIRNFIQRHFEIILQQERFINFPLSNKHSINLNDQRIIDFRSLLEKQNILDKINVVFTNEYIIVDIIGDQDIYSKNYDISENSANSTIQKTCENFLIYFLNNFKLETGYLSITTNNDYEKKPLKLIYNSVLYENGQLFFKFSQEIFGVEYFASGRGSIDFFRNNNLLPSLLELIDESCTNMSFDTDNNQKIKADLAELNKRFVDQNLNIELKKSNNKIKPNLIAGEAHHYFFESNEQSRLIKDFICALGDYQYLIWCIKNVDSFYIDDEVLDEGFNDYSISFNARSLESGLIKYSINLDVNKILPNAQIVEMNSEKLDFLLNQSRNTSSNWEGYDWDGYEDASDYYNDALDMDQQSHDYWDNV